MGGEHGDRLLALVEPYLGGKNSISAADLAGLPWNSELCSAVAKCLLSLDEDDISWGIYFCHGIGRSECGKGLMELLRAELPALVGHPSTKVREVAVPLLVQFRTLFPEYRDLMLHALRDSYSEVRTHALAAYRTFLKAEDIPRLMHFADDDYVSEVPSGTGLIFLIRDQAFEVVEALSGKKFPRKRMEIVVEEGTKASYWDWEPIKKAFARRRWWSCAAPGTKP